MDADVQSVMIALPTAGDFEHTNGKDHHLFAGAALGTVPLHRAPDLPTDVNLPFRRQFRLSSA